MTKMQMKLSRRQTLAGLSATTALTFTGCTSVDRIRPGALDEARQIGADHLLDGVAYSLLEHSPAGATSLGVDTGKYAALRGKLADQSPAGIAALADQLRGDLALVRKYPREGLSDETVTSLEVVESAYSKALEGFALPYGDVAVGGWRNAPYVVIQNVGNYLDLPRFMDSTQPLNDMADADAFTARMEAVPDSFAGELTRMQSARAMGVVPPDFLLDKAIAQIERTLTSAKAGELFAAPMRARLAEKNLPESYADKVAMLERDAISKALEDQLAELKAERAIAGSDPGMWSQPHGEEWYAWALSAATTTNLSPAEIHKQGLEQLRDVQSRMDRILRQIGYGSGSVGKRVQALRDDPRYKFSEGDPGRKEIMDFIHERIEWIKAQMPRAFNTLVDPKLEVRRLPPSEEPGAPSAYGGSGSKDGSIPGRMWINLHTTELHRKFDLPSLIFHETIPGHVWEGEFSNRLPLIRSTLSFSAFSEGWALYGEQLAEELGAYEGNPAGQLGYLQKVAWRAARMVTDTGLHAKQWSRQQAIDFFLDEVALSVPETVSEIERYCSWPGQACAYLVGKMEILKQRKRAQEELGPAYDLKAFDDAVVLGGNAPMSVLAKNVSRYIERARR
ncbi:DUF885 domain-containing protein [Altererythrobacter sp.]|uniref:DUF885 domain-containing protein n=1 Tax=Altererythrobacter sp. TaxID=1872480 RepID=UPI003D0D5453